ncbi:hypothetical protein YQE_08685, partial [Dendroctonus ponderosae]
MAWGTHVWNGGISHPGWRFRESSGLPDGNYISADENHKFGFRGKPFTELQLLRIVEGCAKEMNQKRTTGILPLDVERAFDRVWRKGLIYKMAKTGISKKMCQLIDSCICKRTFSVKVENYGQRTEAQKLECRKERDIPRTSNTTLALFADDTALMSSSWRKEHVRRNLQLAADELQKWFIKWKVKVNATKSQAILIGRKCDRIVGNINLGGANNIRYLGVVLDTRLTWRQHMTTAINKAKASTAMLHPLLNRRSQMSVRNKLLLIKSVIRPAMTYPSTVWGYAAKTYLRQLQATENKLLRMAIDAPWFVRNTQIYRDLKWEPLRDFLQRKAASTFEKAENHPFVELRNAVDYSPEDAGPRKKRPRHQMAQQGNR